jgi:hypothetical protein
VIASIEFEITLSAIAGAGWYRRGEQLRGQTPSQLAKVLWFFPSRKNYFAS